MITCIMSGLYLGEIFCFLLSGYLVVSSATVWGVEMGGWVSVYWVFGVVGLLWVPLWVKCIYEAPEDHPTISSEELTMLLSNRHRHEAIDVTCSAEDSGLSQQHDSSRLLDIEMHNNVRSAPSSCSGGKSSISIGHTLDISSSSFLRRVTSGSSMQGRHEEDPLKGGFRDHEDSFAPPLEEVEEDDAAVLAVSSSTSAPWAAFFVHPASVTLLVCFWTQNWIGYLILSELPTYFTEQLGFGLKSAGLLSMAPYIAQFLSTLLFGFLFQWLQQHRNWSTRDVRQWAQHTCFIGASGCLVLCGFVSDSAVATCLMVAALGFYGSCQSGLACAFLDISPRYSSTLNTVANVFGSLAGVVTPLIVSACTDRYAGVWGWRYVFLLTALQCLFSSVLWYTYQTSSVVKVLNTPPPPSSSKSFWASLLFDQGDLCSLWVSCEVKNL